MTENVLILGKCIPAIDFVVGVNDKKNPERKLIAANNKP